MTVSPYSLSEIDLSDPELFALAVPHQVFAMLRREDPVRFNPEPDGPGFWAVTRYEDIRAVHRDIETFSSEVGGTQLASLAQDEIDARKTMMDMDPPRHGELRAMLNRRFTRRAVGVWEARIREIVRDVLAEAFALGEFDFVAKVSAEVPMQVFAEFMGIPLEDRGEIIEVSNRLVGTQDPEFSLGPDHEDRLLPCSSPAGLEMFELGRRLRELRRGDPEDDIVTQLAFGDMTPGEYDNYFLLVAVGGSETTRHTITHGLVALLEHQDQLERLRADPSLLGVATEEMLRWATPVHRFRRTATRDVELAGTKIAAGDKVTTWFVSGNRDERMFPDPETFDVARSPNPHMAFGPGGIHHCMGAHLARLEIRVFFEELLAQPVEIELAGPPDRLRSNFFNGIKRLPVRLRKTRESM
jgi:cytochrome P450